MHNSNEAIFKIELDLDVDGEHRTLAIPIPFDYDGEGILKLVEGDLLSPSPVGSAHTSEPARSPDDEGTMKLTGEMDALAYDDWKSRANELAEVESAEFILDDLGLTPGCWPGILNDRGGEPSTLMLDETIELDLYNVAITDNDTKAAFRSMREACGASQAALAEALDVNPRTVKRWETPGQPEPPRDAWQLVRSWHADAVSGAQWHMRQAEALREECHEAYTLVIYRNQEEFDRELAPLLANAPSYRWQDALEAQRNGETQNIDERRYTNFPGTRAYWRANAAARMAAVLMASSGIPHGFAYTSEQKPSLFWDGVWVPRVDVQRIEGPDSTMIVCGMR